MIETPNALRACASCGREPDPALRLKYLAGCPDGHDVHTWYEIIYLAEGIAHLWDDDTYSALRYQERWLGESPQTILLAWLDACHEGRTNRRQRVEGEMVQYDDMIVKRYEDPETGDVTVTYHLPLIDGEQNLGIPALSWGNVTVNAEAVGRIRPEDVGINATLREMLRG